MLPYINQKANTAECFEHFFPLGSYLQLRNYNCLRAKRYRNGWNLPKSINALLL